MGVFVTTIISYSNENRMEYQLYAEFLRLAGIYVWEQCESGDNEKPELLEPAPEILYYRIKNGKTGSGKGRIFSENAQRRRLDALFQHWEINLKQAEFSEAYPLLLDSFVSNDLFEAGATLQYFRMNSELVEMAGKRFLKAAHRFTNGMAEQDLYHNRYLRYAQLYCLQKTNYAYHLRKKTLAIDVDFLAEQCRALLEEYPDFTNVWVLQGMVYEIVPQRLRNSVNAFEHAISSAEPYPFLSSIYYWIGKRYESAVMYKEQMEWAYQKAYALDPKYRISYKMGMIYENRESWPEALFYYRECINKILLKGSYLDPLEQEYLFKTYVRIAYIYLEKLKKNERSIDMADKALELRKRIQEGVKASNRETKYYFEMYGKRKAADYIALELNRMGVRKACQILSTAYRNLGEVEAAKKYAGMIEW